MAKSKEKLQALLMRREGQSIKEIAKIIGVSPGSVSKWVQDIELTNEQREYLRIRQIASGHRGRVIGAEMNRAKRITEIKLANSWAKETVGNLSDRDILLAGTALYWGEGAKGRKFTFTSSDPKALIFSKIWLTRVLGVLQEDLWIRISINESHRYRYSAVEDFWVNTLEIPRNQFYKPTFIKTALQKVYENEQTYYGVVALGCRKSTALQYRVLGLISALTSG